MFYLWLVTEPETSVQTEVGEASENEKEVVEPEPQRQPEPVKRKQTQVRPWDIGKEGELWVELYLVNLFKLHMYLFCSSIFYFNL